MESLETLRVDQQKPETNQNEDYEELPSELLQDVKEWLQDLNLVDNNVQPNHFSQIFS